MCDIFPVMAIGCDLFVLGRSCFDHLAIPNGPRLSGLIILRDDLIIQAGVDKNREVEKLIGEKKRLKLKSVQMGC